MKPRSLDIVLHIVGIFATLAALGLIPIIVTLGWMNPDMTTRRFWLEYPWLCSGQALACIIGMICVLILERRRWRRARPIRNFAEFCERLPPFEIPPERTSPTRQEFPLRDFVKREE
jgi:hypothetical protein